MIAFIITIAIAVTILLNLTAVKKITNKTSKICFGGLNILLSLIFVGLFIVVGIVETHLNSFIDMGIAQLENKVDEIYPGMLEKQVDTEELKIMLEESLEIKDVSNLENLAENIIKSNIQDYTSAALNTLNALERDKNKLSAKDALISIKELSLNAISPYFKIVKIVISVLYALAILISLLLSKSFAKDSSKKNKGIVFGEEADNTSLGMKTE